VARERSTARTFAGLFFVLKKLDYSSSENLKGGFEKLPSSARLCASTLRTLERRPAENRAPQFSSRSQAFGRTHGHKLLMKRDPFFFLFCFIFIHPPAPLKGGVCVIFPYS
jgi:hypothetical protein